MTDLAPTAALTDAPKLPRRPGITPAHTGVPRAPDPVDHELIPTSTHQIDRAVETMGLPKHDPPPEIAEQLKALAKLLTSSDTPRAIRGAAVLAARGWPTATMGDGTGSRSTSSTTSVERAARIEHEQQDPGHWDDIDRTIAGLLQLIGTVAGRLQSTITDVLAHGQDIDEVPVGHGQCMCCEHFCRPQRNPNDRLRSGLCDSCRKAWARARYPERTDWIHGRRHRLNDGKAGSCLSCERPWTDIGEGAA